METSFWVAGYRAEILGYCIDLLDIVVPRAVADELTQPSSQGGEAPYTTLFRQLQNRIQAPPTPEPDPIPQFGKGAGAALALANELKAGLLTNERAVKTFGANYGLEVWTVPAVIVALCDQGILPPPAARTRLELMQHFTHADIIK